MATKLWVGAAPAVAQVSTATPANVQIGDTFTLTINGKSISVVAAAATPESVVALLVAAVNSSTIPEFQEVLASAVSGVCYLTAREAGKPFTVSSGTSDSSSLAVSIETTQNAVAEVQSTHTFRIPLSAAGTFTITIGDQTTSALAVGASAATVDTAVEGLSTIGAGNCSTTKTTDANDDIYELKWVNTLSGLSVGTAIVQLTSTKPLVRTTQAGATTGTPRNEIQTVAIGTGTGGTFTLTLDGQTTSNLAASSTADNVRDALQALSNVETVTVTKDSGTNETTFTIEFTGIDGNANQTQLVASSYSASGSTLHQIAVAVVGPTAGVNEKQTVTLIGGPTGGTFTLTYSGQTTSAIAYNASAATVDAALEALSNIGAGDVTVTGSAGGPWVVEFTGALQFTDVVLMTGNGASLTGTNTQTLTIATPTANSGPHCWDVAGNWSPSGVPITGDAVRFELGSSDCLYGLDQNAVTLASLHVSMQWAGSLGLPRMTTTGYQEYRTRELTAGITSVIVGTGEGSGPRKVALNTGTVVTSITVLDSGGSSEANVPAVIWRGDNVSNTIVVNGGDFGSSWWSDQTSRISSLIQRGGTVFLKNCTIVDSLDVTEQEFRAYLCTLGTKSLNA